MIIAPKKYGGKMMNKKRIFRMIAMVLLLSTMLSTAAFAMTPGQVKHNRKNKNKFENAFKYMRESGIMCGYGDGNYGLGDYVKRGDITVMIVRAFKLSMMDASVEELEEDDFLDLIDKGSYYYNSVKTAKKLGIAKGDGKNFHPNRYVSYEEAMLLIERAVKAANSKVTVTDKDGEKIKLKDWYEEFVKKDSDAFNEYLKELLKDEGIEDFKESAAREDIALMLYYVLTGNKDYWEENSSKLPAIKETMKENTVLSFNDVDFDDIFEDYDMVKVKFVLPDKEKGILKINKKDLSNIKYEIESIEDITFVPADDCTGKVEIKYTVYDDDNVSYDGVIEITILDVFEIKDIVIENYDAEDIDFAEELKYADKEMFKIIDCVTFKLPKTKEGKLYIKYDRDGDDKNDEEFVPAVENKRYCLDEIEGLKYKPYDDGDDEITIFYTAYDKITRQDKKYDGAIVIEID